MKKGRYRLSGGVVVALVTVLALVILIPNKLMIEFIHWNPRTFASANALIEPNHPLLVAETQPTSKVVDLKCQVQDKDTHELILEPGHAEIKVDGFAPYNVDFSEGKFAKKIPNGTDFAINPIMVPGYWPIGGNMPVQMADEGMACTIALTSVSRPQPAEKGYNVVQTGLPVKNPSSTRNQVGSNTQPIAYIYPTAPDSEAATDQQTVDPRDAKIARAFCFEGLKLKEVKSAYVLDTIGSVSNGVRVETNVLTSPNAEPGDCKGRSSALEARSRVFNGKQVLKVTATVVDKDGRETTREFVFDTDCANRFVIPSAPPVTPPPPPATPSLTPPVAACLILEKKVITGANPNKWRFQVTVVGTNTNTYNLDSNSQMKLGVPKNSTIIVEELPQDGWQVASVSATGNNIPAAIIGNVVTVVTRDDSNCVTVVFTNQPRPQISTSTTCITIEKRDIGGNLLPNWTFKVSTPGQPGQVGSGFLYQATDSSGQVRFNNFPLNSPATVEEILQSGTANSYWQMVSIAVNGNSVASGNSVVSTTVLTGNDPNNCTQVKFVNQLIGTTTTATVATTCLTIVKITNGVLQNGLNFQVTGAGQSGQTYGTGATGILGQTQPITNLTLNSQIVVTETGQSIPPVSITSSYGNVQQSGFTGTAITRPDGSCQVLTFVNQQTIVTVTPTPTGTQPTLAVNTVGTVHDPVNNRYTITLQSVPGNCSGTPSYTWSAGTSATTGAVVTVMVNAGETKTGTATVTCSNGTATANWSAQGPSIQDPPKVSIQQNGGWTNNNDGTYILKLLALPSGGGGCPCTYVWTGATSATADTATLKVAAGQTGTATVTVTFTSSSKTAQATASFTAPQLAPSPDVQVSGFTETGWIGSGSPRSNTLTATVVGGCSDKTFSWTIVQGSGATLSNQTGASVTVTAPTGTTVKVQVVVTTCNGAKTATNTYNGNPGATTY